MGGYASRGATAALAAFVIVERRVASPMLDLSLFRGRLFSTARAGLDLAAQPLATAVVAPSCGVTLPRFFKPDPSRPTPRRTVRTQPGVGAAVAVAGTPGRRPGSGRASGMDGRRRGSPARPPPAACASGWRPGGPPTASRRGRGWCRARRGRAPLHGGECPRHRPGGSAARARPRCGSRVRRTCNVPRSTSCGCSGRASRRRARGSPPGDRATAGASRSVQACGNVRGNRKARNVERGAWSVERVRFRHTRSLRRGIPPCTMACGGRGRLCDP